MLSFQVYMMVDYGSFDRTRSFAGRFSNLKSKILFVGGANRLDNLPGTKATQNFHGCLRGVSFTIHRSIIFKWLSGLLLGKYCVLVSGTTWEVIVAAFFISWLLIGIWQPSIFVSFVCIIYFWTKNHLEPCKHHNVTVSVVSYLCTAAI